MHRQPKLIGSLLAAVVATAVAAAAPAAADAGVCPRNSVDLGGQCSVTFPAPPKTPGPAHHPASDELDQTSSESTTQASATPGCSNSTSSTSRG